MNELLFLMVNMSEDTARLVSRDLRLRANELELNPNATEADLELGRAIGELATQISDATLARRDARQRDWREESSEGTEP